MRAPLAQARGLGSAKDGTAHWWAQRVTALALVPLTFWFVMSIVTLVGADHATAVTWLKSAKGAIPMALFLVAALYHGQLGLQVVIEDYVHHTGLKIAGLVLLKFATLVVGAAAGFGLIKIVLGS